MGLEVLTPQPEVRLMVSIEHGAQEESARKPERTDDKVKVIPRIARVDQDASNLSPPLAELARPGIHLPIQVIRPLQPDPHLLIPFDALDRLHHGQSKQVLKKDNLPRVWEGEAQDERELKATGWGDPRVGAPSSAGNLVGSEADESCG